MRTTGLRTPQIILGGISPGEQHRDAAAAYEARGLYRPEADCIMFPRDPVGFCRVCRLTIARIIDLYSK
jgi:hypothetical protein